MGLTAKRHGASSSGEENVLGFYSGDVQPPRVMQNVHDTRSLPSKCWKCHPIPVATERPPAHPPHPSKLSLEGSSWPSVGICAGTEK